MGKKKTRSLTIKEKARQFSSGVDQIQKKHRGNVRRQSVEASKLSRKLDRKRVKLP